MVAQDAKVARIDQRPKGGEITGEGRRLGNPRSGINGALDHPSGQ
jgi:hypothetical protein